MPISERKLSILVIEDNMGDYVLIEDYIREELRNVAVTHATTFEQAKKAILEEVAFDVILLDLTLPDCSGEELVNEALRLGKETPLIVLTGYSNKIFSVKTLSLGVSDYLLKDELSAAHLYKSITYSIERKRINNELKQSEEKYRNLFYSSPTPTWIYDPDTFFFLDVNAAASRHYGYSREEFLAMTIYDIRPEKDRERVREVVNLNRHTQNYFEGIFEHYKKNGELIQVNILSNSVIFSGKSARLVVSNDITEKLKAEIQIKEINDRYNLVSKATSDAIWDYKFDNKIYVAGTGFKYLFGYPIVNTSVDKIEWEKKIHPDDKKMVLKKLENFINDPTQKQIQYDYRFLKSNGVYAYVTDRLFIIRENGVPVRITGAMNDITKRKEEEHHLKLLESIITNTNEAAMITEAGSLDEPGPKIIYVNKALVKMTGYTEKEILGRSPRMFQGEESDREELYKMKWALRKDQSYSSEIINYTKSGRPYWASIDIAPVTDVTGKVSHFIAIQRDITNRKLQEQEREKLISELIQNNKDLRQFSYITSHNLRGPIANLLGLTNLLDLYKVKDATLSKIMDGIKKAAKNFDETIKDLSTVLNIKDRPSIPREDIELASTHAKILSQFRDIIDEKDVKINTDFSKAPSVNFNKAYLESIFSNLLTNAVKYRLNSGTLVISISSEENGDEIILKFQDNGRGINLELHKEKLFGLYQRFHENTEGKGLGLFLVKSQMEALNGHIRVESKINEGALFILHFKKTFPGK